MTYSTMEIMDMGLACLVEKLGVINAEHFVTAIKRERFDYTAWQREFFDQMETGKIRSEALAYAENHPHKGKGKRL